MKPALTVRTPNALYAHAIAIEREAVERYTELAQHMADLGNDAVAALFRTLAAYETEHLDALKARTAGIPLPRIAQGAYAWLDEGAPETAAHELIFRLITPRQVLAIALDAERRAQQFFATVQATAGDAALRALAQEMAAEEQEHVAMVEQALARAPEGRVDWAAVFGD